LHGVRNFRVALDRMLDLAAGASDRLRRVPGIEVPREPELSIALFRATDGDEATQAILDALNGSGRFHVSSTTLDGLATIRFAFLQPRTTGDVLDELIDMVESAGR
jgi:glutamate/tyrosine decarboxylase-like PLP-dependent enzyme